MAVSIFSELKISRNVAQTIAATFKGKITNRLAESVHHRGKSYSVFEKFRIENAVPADAYKMNLYKDIFDYNDQGKQIVDVGDNQINTAINQDLSENTAAIPVTIKVSSINFDVTVSGLLDESGHGQLLLRMENISAYINDTVSIDYRNINLLLDPLTRQRLKMLGSVTIQRTPILQYIKL